MTTTSDTKAMETAIASGAKVTVEMDWPLVMCCAVLTIAGEVRQIKNVYARPASRKYARLLSWAPGSPSARTTR
jgi:hypothetical protein